MAPENRTAESIIARLATASHGVVTRAELLAAGVSDDEVKHRARTGALLRVHRGVYRVGHRAPSIEADYLAAVKACGPGAVLSGRAAGHLLGALKGPPPRPEVSAPTERRIEGVSTKRRRQIDRREVTSYRNIPVTTVPRTLVDLAPLLDAEDLAKAFHEVGIRHRTTPADVERVLQRHPTAPRAKQLRAILHGDTPVTLSALERAFLELLDQAGLPRPQTNRRAGSYRVDCRWPQQRLTVELDGYRYHRSRHAWERDRRREREARARGDDFRRFTYADVVEDPRAMLAELAEALRSLPSTLR